MKWAVEIQKTNLGRRNLTDLLAGLGFAVVETPGHLAFTSDELHGCRTTPPTKQTVPSLAWLVEHGAREQPATRHPAGEPEPARLECLDTFLISDDAPGFRTKRRN